MVFGKKGEWKSFWIIRIIFSKDIYILDGGIIFFIIRVIVYVLE